MRWFCAIIVPVAAAEKQGVRMRSADGMEQTANDSETEISSGEAEEQNQSLSDQVYLSLSPKTWKSQIVYWLTWNTWI